MINMSTSLNWVYRMPFSLIKPMRQLSSIVETPKIGLFGINEDRNSSFLAGSSDAPDIIRKAMFCDSHNTWSELGFNVLDHISDYGNVRPGSCSLQSIEEAIMPTVQDMARLNMKPLFLGGDHSVTSCFVKALYECTKKPMAIVHFDAHPDFYHNFEDNNSSHASPMARICEHDSACVKLISVGIRALTLHQKEQMTKFNASCVEARHFPAHGSDLGKILSQLLPKGVQVYITFDMDVLEPGVAPGVSHREAGGLTPRQAIDAIHSIPGEIVGADVVEYNPLYDVGAVSGITGGAGVDRVGVTGEIAAKIARELAAVMLRSSNISNI